jgi:hypothetical protein
MFQLNEYLSEFVGIMLGDGCISKYKNHNYIKYALRIDGNSNTEKLYYKHIQCLINKITGRDVKIKFRNYGNNIFVYFHHKNLALFLNTKLGFPFGKKKNLEISNEILRNEKNLNFLLKGFFDTDGCLYFTKNNSEHRAYPIIELSTHDITLLRQLKTILEKKGFIVAVSHYGDSIKLHGKGNVEKWMNEIGSSNIDNYSKFLFWKKYGFCPKVNELSLSDRLEKLE